jgi:hypothetical protein
MPKIAVATLLLLVVACGSRTVVRATSADARGVTFDVPVGREGEAMHRAMLYCANLGRRAVLVATRPETRDLSIAVYDCR